MSSGPIGHCMEARDWKTLTTNLMGEKGHIHRISLPCYTEETGKEYFFNFIRSNEDKEADPEMPKTFFPESPYDDSQLLEVALSYAEVVDGYQDRMQSIIGTTQRQLYRLRDYGYSE